MEKTSSGLRKSQTSNITPDGWHSAMPHIVVKIRLAYSQAQKEHLAATLASSVVEILDCPMFDDSIGMEVVPQKDWTDNVVIPEIRKKAAIIYKLPGYESVKQGSRLV